MTAFNNRQVLAQAGRWYINNRDESARITPAPGRVGYAVGEPVRSWSCNGRIELSVVYARPLKKTTCWYAPQGGQAIIPADRRQGVDNRVRSWVHQRRG